MSDTDRTQQNIQLIADLMTGSAYGPLAQVFIIHAISAGAQKVSDASPARFDSANMRGEDWTGVAREIRDKLAAALDARPD